MSDYNIGNIYAELSMDITSLEASKRKAIKELGNLRDEGDKILKEAGGKMTEAMKIRLDEIEKNKAEILKSIDDLNKQIREKSNPIKEVLGLHWLKRLVWSLSQKIIVRILSLQNRILKSLSRGS